MKKVLKTVLALGLVASSSFALAEGKFVFRQPLQGVDGQQYYGMSQSQIDDAIAEQERLAQIEADKAMCLNESTWMEEVTKTRYVSETRYRTKYKTETRTRTAYRTETYQKTWPLKYSGQGTGSYYWGDSGGPNVSSLAKYGSKSCSTKNLPISSKRTCDARGGYKIHRGTIKAHVYQGKYYAAYMTGPDTREVPYQQSYTVQVPYEEPYTVQVPEEYQETEQVKSENYNYCVDKGYPTDN